MGRKIPEPIRRNVIRQWLEGVPRQQIARSNQIGTGTVSEIIKTIKEKGTETQIDVLREIAVMLRRQGLSIGDFGDSIRLKQFLYEIGLKEEKLEDFAKHLDIHCFKRGLTPDEFMNLVAKISSFSDDLGIPIEELPERINGLKTLLDDINLQIRDLMTKQKRVMANYNVTMADLEEYRMNRPLLETLKAKNVELERVRRRMNRLEIEKQYEWSVAVPELDRVNKGLMPIDVDELGKLAKDLFHCPSKYPDIIRIMRERCELQPTLTN